MEWQEELEAIAKAAHVRLEALDDPWSLLLWLEDYDRTLSRVPYYPNFLALLAEEPMAGARDALIVEGRRVFRTTVRAIRRDLQALEEVRHLERMLGQ